MKQIFVLLSFLFMSLSGFSQITILDYGRADILQFDKPPVGAITHFFMLNNRNLIGVHFQQINQLNQYFRPQGLLYQVVSNLKNNEINGGFIDQLSGSVSYNWNVYCGNDFLIFSGAGLGVSKMFGFGDSDYMKRSFHTFFIQFQGVICYNIAGNFLITARYSNQSLWGGLNSEFKILNFGVGYYY